MSWVWNVMLSFSDEERCGDSDDEPTDSCEPLDRINSWIEDGKLVDLTKPTYAKNAGYGLDANLYGGGFNHFDIEDFINVVESQPWKERQHLQLWIKGEEPESFTLVKLSRPQPTRKMPTPVFKPKTKPRAQAKRKRRGF